MNSQKYHDILEEYGYEKAADYKSECFLADALAKFEGDDIRNGTSSWLSDFYNSYRGRVEDSTPTSRDSVLVSEE